MAGYTFKWEQPAEEVYVTGTFDNWTKSVKLEKDGSVFQKTVDLAPTEKIYYKFVVDNNWVTNDSLPKEADPEGNVNNFLTADNITKSNPAAATINSVGPEASTLAMAAAQPKEGAATPSDIPGGFPETPAADLDKTISVNPLPATTGAVNPVTLAPGEKIPDSITAQSTTDNVTLDKESYEKSDRLPGVDSTNATIATVGPGATTAALAGAVPKEPKVPAVVKESQDKAGADPEASAVPAEVADKAKVEEELKDKVPEAPSAAEGTSGVGTEKKENAGGIYATAAATGGAVMAAAIAAKDAVVDRATPAVNQATATAADAADKNLPQNVKDKLPVAAQEAIAGQPKVEENREEVSPEVPVEVRESIVEAGKSPEAAGSTAAVVDKKAVESELLKEVKPTPAEGTSTGSEVKPEDIKPTSVTTDKPTGGANAAAPVTAIKPAAETPTTAIKPVTETPPAETTAKPTNGADTSASATAIKPAAGSTPAAETTSTAADKKKKNRLSAMLSKFKHKISDKN